MIEAYDATRVRSFSHLLYKLSEHLHRSPKVGKTSVGNAPGAEIKEWTCGAKQGETRVQDHKRPQQVQTEEPPQDSNGEIVFNETKTSQTCPTNETWADIWWKAQTETESGGQNIEGTTGPGSPKRLGIQTNSGTIRPQSTSRSLPSSGNSLPLSWCSTLCINRRLRSIAACTGNLLHKKSTLCALN